MGSEPPRALAYGAGAPASAGVRVLADVRAFPSSRRHPQFNVGALGLWLAEAGIDCVHVPELGVAADRVVRAPAFAVVADSVVSYPPAQPWLFETSSDERSRSGLD